MSKKNGLIKNTLGEESLQNGGKKTNTISSEK